ncbi:MAG: xanthine dehydrogenase family protein molybdopterin-binding subunit [Geobacter sp.]|nr:xanthine dehydrogenase family protein molybdopterin-binding subunit [Geobacter sp.]
MQSIPPLTIGTAAPRGDAAAKAAGTEPYAADRYPKDCLWAGAVRSNLPAGRIISIDTSAAKALPGVVTVLTAADVAGSNRQGIIHKDMPVLCDQQVRYIGDPLALVLAEDRSTLHQAVKLVRFELEPLAGLFDLDSALAADAPLIHEDQPGNLLAQASICKGQGLDGFSDCAVVVEGRFSTPVQAHAFLETESGVARLEEDGGLLMEVSTQSPFRDRFEISHALGIPWGKIRIVAPSLGGGFGGKDGATVQCLLGLAAQQANGRWVRMQWDREESFKAGYKRHACRMEYRLGAKADGTLQALHARLWYDTGAYAHLGAEVMELGMEHAGGPYRIPHTQIEGWCVYTNNPVAGAMRAFGVCQATFVFESMMDLLAAKLGMDPLELRLKNALVRGDENCAGMRLTSSTGIKTCLEQLQQHPFWQQQEQWKAAAPRFKQRGIGLAAVFNAAGYGGGVRDAATAKIELTADGSFVVHNAVADMGQGNSSAFLQIAGHILSQDASRVSLKQPDTRTAYPSGSSSAGRTTYTFGKALITATEELRSRLLNMAGMILFLQDNDGLELQPGRVVHLPSNKEITLAQLAGYMQPEERVCLGQYVAPTCKDIPPTAKGFFIGFPHVIFGYGAHLVRLELDSLTGQLTVCDYLAVTDGGRVLNPMMFDQQVQGGVAQGLGYALMEDFTVQDGMVKTPDFATYLIPGSLDVPEIVSIAAQGEPEETGPFGMKGIGEVAMNGPLPTVANAVADACGVRLCHGPLTPQRVLAGLQGELLGA